MGRNICSVGKRGQGDSALVELEWAKRTDGKKRKNNQEEICILNTMNTMAESQRLSSAAARFQFNSQSVGIDKPLGRHRMETYDAFSQDGSSHQLIGF